MRVLRLSSAAEQQLEDILFFTFAEWGEAQAEKYAALIDKCLSHILANPNLGKLRADVKPGYRALQAGKHLIFYCVQDEFIDVLGILHIHMDATRYFDDISN
jgi:toxin ParE1/3/4